MKRLIVFFLIVASVSAIVSCHKNSSGPNAGHGPNALFPLTAGDTWYYQDSIFNDTMLTGVTPDTATVNSQRLTDNAGNVYVGITNPRGWFQGSYILVDPGNTTVYEVDSPAYNSYVFFQAVGQDGIIGTGFDANNGCPLRSIQYGYATPVTVAGYPSLKNAEVITDCNNVIREQVISYLSPGVGVVRIEDYVSDSISGNKLYEDYSQTLTNKVLH